MNDVPAPVAAEICCTHAFVRREMVVLTDQQLHSHDAANASRDIYRAVRDPLTKEPDTSPK